MQHDLTREAMEEEERFHEYRRLAEKGDPEATYDVAMSYLTGGCAPENAEEGWKWMAKAAKRGYADAVFHVFKHYKEVPAGCCSGADVTKWLSRIADKGNSYAMFLLGKLYEEGELAAKDERRAFRLYHQAVKKGMAPAQVPLACCYLYGRGVVQNVDKGLERLIDAALEELQPAYYVLGTLYHEGKLVPRDDLEALRWLRKAAACKDEKAVALITAMGAEVEEGPVGDSPQELFTHGQDLFLNSDDDDEIEEGYQMMEKAAEAGYGAALYFLGNVFYTASGENRDVDRAESLWLQVTDDPEFQGLVDDRLADLYWSRPGSPEDDGKLVHHARIAAGKNFAASMYILACCAMQGRGMAQDLAEAAKWFARALESRKLEAAAPLFDIHCRTNGSLPDTRKAAYWIRLAAERGHADAQLALARHLSTLPGAANKANALKWFKRAAAQGATPQEDEGSADYWGDETF